MSEAATVHFTEESGDDWTKTLTFTKSDGTAQDISGWTVYLTLKEDYTVDDANAAYTQDVTSHNDPTNGVTSVSIPSADSESLDGTYVYDIAVETGANTDITIMQGRFKWIPSPTTR